MTEAERARSMNRSPSSDWVPWESLRWMTGPRSARSAALLVGSVLFHEIWQGGYFRAPDLKERVDGTPCCYLY